VADLSPPRPTDAVIREGGSMEQEFMLWTQDITSQINANTAQVNLNTIVDGSGSPEGVLTAEPNKLYRDTAGPNLYWKSTGSGNTGWLLVV